MIYKWFMGGSSGILKELVAGVCGIYWTFDIESVWKELLVHDVTILDENNGSIGKHAYIHNTRHPNIWLVCYVSI